MHDAQLTVARGYGFTGWPALAHYLQVAAGLSIDPSRIDEDTLVMVISDHGFAPFRDEWQQLDTLANAPVKVVSGAQTTFGTARGGESERPLRRGAGHGG